MPELPAMENFRLAIEEQALDKKIVSFLVKPDRVVRIKPEVLSTSLVGQKFLETHRHGKYVFIRTGKGTKAIWLSFHCGMTGYFTFPKKGEDTKILSKAKFLVNFSDGSAMAFFDPRMLGRVELINTPEDFIAAHELGPDVNDVTADQFVKTLQSSKKALKVFFLDQSIMAGIGNVYGDEIPFQAKIDPRRKGSSFSDAECKKLYTKMVAVLKLATEKKAYLHHWDMLPKSWLIHHRKVGENCPRCSGKVESYKAAGRDGYWCPDCQK